VIGRYCSYYYYLFGPEFSLNEHYLRNWPSFPFVISEDTFSILNLLKVDRLIEKISNLGYSIFTLSRINQYQLILEVFLMKIPMLPI